MTNDPLRWRTSSHSTGTGGNCVQAAARPDGRAVLRDSKHPELASLALPPHAWRDLLAAIRRL